MCTLGAQAETNLTVFFSSACVLTVTHTGSDMEFSHSGTILVPQNFQGILDFSREDRKEASLRGKDKRATEAM